MIRFALDYGGTIADTNLVKSQWIKKNMGIHVPPWRCDRTLCERIIGVEKYNEIAKCVYGRDLSLSAPEVRGVKQALVQLRELGTIFVLTARDTEKLQLADMWLGEHNMRDDIDELFSCVGEPKLRFCRKFRIDVLIDDDQRHVFESEPPDICKILLKNGMPGILEVPGYVTLCRDWGEVVTTVKQWIVRNKVEL